MVKMRFLFASIVMMLGCATMQAQSIKDILSGVVDKVVDKATGSSASIVGTWTYDSPATEFESDNTLASLGGTAVSSKVNSKLTSVYKKVGVTGSQITFSEDGSYSMKIKNKTSKGTYTYDSSSKTITMKPTIGGSLTAYASFGTNSLSLLFDSSKLMSGLKTLTNMASSVNSTASIINSVIGNYDGMKLGFKMKK